MGPALEVVLGEHEHPSHQVGGGDTLGSLAFLVLACGFNYVISICSISCHCNIITVYAELTVISE